MLGSDRSRQTKHDQTTKHALRTFFLAFNPFDKAFRLKNELPI